MYGLVVMSDMGANLHQKGYCKLAYVVSSIYRYVLNRDSFGFCILIIYYIVTSCQNCDCLDIRAFVNRLFADRGLVDNNNFCITDTLSDQRRLLIRCTIIYCYFSKCLQRLPADISRVFSVTIQYYDFHFALLLL